MTEADKELIKDVAIYGVSLACGCGAELIVREFVSVMSSKISKPLYFLGAFGIILSVGVAVQNSVEKTIHGIID